MLRLFLEVRFALTLLKAGLLPAVSVPDERPDPGESPQMANRGLKAGRPMPHVTSRWRISLLILREAHAARAAS